ncbi:MAG TPA: hypothetical protein VFO67_15620 [Gemmatimonadales bacterium]|nr:hypothetical protein [Gemmatimonadales bacterium]
MSDLVDRKALERIIRRAAELQAGSQDVGEGLTSKEVLALGKDVGIPEGYLRQAMLEEQTRSADEGSVGTWAWLTGPRSIGAHRVVPGDRAGVERALNRWMMEEELLQPRRQYADRTTWEAKPGAFASIQRALSGRRRYSLASAAQISSQIVQLEPGFCLVRLEADVSQQRRARISGGMVLATIGWAMTGAAALLAPPLALAQILTMVPGLGLTVGAAAIARTHRTANERVEIGLEQVLDRLERGEIHSPGQPSLPFVRIAEEVRKVFENPKPKTRG